MKLESSKYDKRFNMANDPLELRDEPATEGLFRKKLYGRSYHEKQSAAMSVQILERMNSMEWAEWALPCAVCGGQRPH